MERRNGLFAPVTDFDWDTFDSPHADDRVTITADDLAEIFENGAKQLRKTEAVKALQALTGAGRTACYHALKLDGRFAKQLCESNGLLLGKRRRRRCSSVFLKGMNERTSARVRETVREQLADKLCPSVRFPRDVDGRTVELKRIARPM